MTYVMSFVNFLGIHMKFVALLAGISALYMLLVKLNIVESVGFWQMIKKALVERFHRSSAERDTPIESSGEYYDVPLKIDLDVYDSDSVNRAKKDIEMLQGYLDLTDDEDSISKIHDTIEKLQISIDEYEQEGAFEAIPTKTYSVDGIPIVIAYRDSKGFLSNRTVEVSEYDGIYMSGYCRLRGERRTFRVDRIISASDGETGESISDLSAYIEEKYINSPRYVIDKAFDEYHDLLRVLIFVVKADGRYTKKEKEIVRGLLLRLIGSDKINEKDIDKMMSSVDIPSLHAFKTAVGRLAKVKDSEGYSLVEVAEQIVSTHKTPHPQEEFAVQYIKKRFQI